MKERVIAKRYGQALFELALESGNLLDIKSEILALLSACRELPTLEKALADDIIDKAKRVSATEKLSKAMGLGKISSGFLKLMVLRGRVPVLVLAAEACIRRIAHREHLSVARASVADAALAAETKASIESAISALLTLKSRCEVGVDPELIGGFETWLGDVRYDASIRGKLERMKEELAGK